MTTEDPSTDDVRVLERFIAGTGDSSLLLTFQGILRSHKRMFQELSTRPSDDVREALSRPLTGGERLTPDEAMQHAYAIAVTRAPGRMTWGEALHHFATWMREHDVRLIAEVRPHGTVTDAEMRLATEVYEDWRAGRIDDADGTIARKVRPHGTVTDAEHYAAALRAIADGDGPDFVREFARDALEVRS